MPAMPEDGKYFQVYLFILDVLFPRGGSRGSQISHATDVKFREI